MKLCGYFSCFFYGDDQYYINDQSFILSLCSSKTLRDPGSVQGEMNQQVVRMLVTA